MPTRSNIGDWLSAKGIQKLLSPLPVTECLCDEPFIEETMQVLSNATERDLIIIGGGGLLMDYFIPFWEAFKPFADRIPFCIWGIGYCDLKEEHSLAPAALIEGIVNKSRLCIVRDELTRSYLPGCDLSTPVACPSINMIDAVTVKGADLLHVANYSTAGAATYDVMCEAANEHAKAHGIIYRETNNIVSKNDEQGLNNILEIYRRSGIILSSALHGCIIGIASGLKVLAVSGDRKIEGFMASIGLSEWVLDTSEVNKVPQYLDKIGNQNWPGDRLKDTREKNQQVAEKIRTFLGH
jgi:polysaccharide pyruvyl transferase WcaK-like protein